MATFLELVQELHDDVGAAGVAPSSVVSQTGEARRLVRYIRRAEGYIVKLWTRWRFMRGTYSQTTTASSGTLSKPSDCKQWDLETFMLDNEPIEAVYYYTVRGEYYDTSVEDQPSRIIIMPNGDLRLDPVPDASTYTITADYYKTHTPMTANGDTSPIPAEFHDVIRARAKILYANFEDAPEIKAQGIEILDEMLPRLEDDQLYNEDHAQFKGVGGFFEVIAE